MRSITDEAHFDLEADHRCDHVSGVADAQPYRTFGPDRGPARQHRRQQVFANREARGDTQRSCAHSAKQALQFTGLLQQSLSAGQQRSAVLVEKESAANTIEQRCTQHGLQVGQRAAGR